MKTRIFLLLISSLLVLSCEKDKKEDETIQNDKVQETKDNPITYGAWSSSNDLTRINIDQNGVEFCNIKVHEIYGASTTSKIYKGWIVDGEEQAAEGAIFRYFVQGGDLYIRDPDDNVAGPYFKREGGFSCSYEVDKPEADTSMYGNWTLYEKIDKGQEKYGGYQVCNEVTQTCSTKYSYLDIYEETTINLSIGKGGASGCGHFFSNAFGGSGYDEKVDLRLSCYDLALSYTCTGNVYFSLNPDGNLEIEIIDESYRVEGNYILKKSASSFNCPDLY